MLYITLKRQLQTSLYIFSLQKLNVEEYFSRCQCLGHVKHLISPDTLYVNGWNLGYGLELDIATFTILFKFLLSFFMGKLFLFVIF